MEVGSHLVEDISNLGFRAGRSVGIERAAFDEVYARLLTAGYELEPPDSAWAALSRARAAYAPRLEEMANYWAVLPTSWFGGTQALRSPTHQMADLEHATAEE